jgi:predicted naringenin-chalcone synthase
MSLAILGTGTAVPSTSFTQDQALLFFQKLAGTSPAQDKLLERVFTHTGIRKRHFTFGRDVIEDVLNGTRHSQSAFLRGDHLNFQGPTTGERMRQYAVHAGPLALEAANQALKRSRLSPADITHLVTVSCTGFHAPGVDIELIQGLHLPATTERTHVGFMGCHGALNGLRVAHALTAGNPRARVLLCAVELSSVHCVCAWDLEQMIACSLFADGAAALVGAASGPSPSSSWRLASSGSCIIPNSTDDMSWNVGDHGFRMTLGKSVPGLVARHLPAWLKNWLEGQGLSLGDVASWCVHPGGPKILQAVSEGLGLAPAALETSRSILADYGNMSSATILFILQRLMENNAARPCVALAFGPGLTAEAALFR